jgi:AraC-like DNA-binding protein
MTHPLSAASILVAHGSPLVSAGLVSILRRLPGCAVRAWQREAPQDAQIVFGDVDSLSMLAEPHNACAFTTPPKFVLVSERDEPTDSQADTLQGLDSRLSIQCGEEELFETVQRLRDRTVSHRNRGVILGGMAPGALRRVKEAIEARLAHGFTLRELATIAGLSEGHFARAFKQSVGLPPHRYLTRRRVNAAAEKIRQSDQSLSEVSLDVGFSDQSHFTRTFAREMGETPSAFRHRHR